jgi:DNA excision repair protein ERCC-4
MLPFANTMFLDLLHEDGLLIAAKGLGIEEVFYNLLRVYSDPGNLVNISFMFIKFRCQIRGVL